MDVRNEAIFRALRTTTDLNGLAPARWDRLVRQARRAGILGRLAVRTQSSEVEDRFPSKVRESLESARLVAAHHERTIQWEVDRLRRALARSRVRIVLLKGAAYVVGRFSAGAGRLASDVDILVPESQLGAVEQALNRSGWRSMKLGAYDQRYYRTWMHELPPLQHETRNAVVDVHHAILPVTSRYRTDSRKLLQSVVWLDDGVGVLGPEDMVLHSATHLFADGDLAGGIREVIDIDSLLRQFDRDVKGFWSRLVPRAQELGLERPLYYALRTCVDSLDTPVPEEVQSSSVAGRPRWPIASIMDKLTARALLPGVEETSWDTEIALWALYVRSHWIRMPLHLLARHLSRKTAQRWFGEGDR